MAPEIITNKVHDNSVDYWSIATIFYWILTGNSPFFNRDSQVMFKNILNKSIEMKSHFSPELCDLLGSLLEIEIK